MKKSKLYARLMPYNKKRGHLVLNYIYKGVRFSNRWKEVSPLVAKHLGEKFQPHDKEDKIPLFQIVEEPKAKEIELQEIEDQGRKTAPRIKDAKPIVDAEFLDADELATAAEQGKKRRSKSKTS
jgi:hypothetical protein